MKTMLNIVGGAFVLTGGIWAGQGAGLIGGSVMTNDPTWLVIGIVLVVLGVVLLLRNNRSKPIDG